MAGAAVSENPPGGRRVHIADTVVICVVVAYRLLQTKPDLAQEASFDARQQHTTGPGQRDGLVK
jgi:hypothetical protein